MTPQTVNAYYNPTRNEIVFPAAILQPPFFDPDADPAINYGGIGAVIGHEISHGFDDQGRKYDADGSLNDWWQADDSAQFDARKGRLGAMYGAFEPLEGFKLNGDLTMGENIGDLGGLLIALDAYHLSLGGKPAPIIDGFTGDQRFFLGFAQIWRAKARDEAMKQQVTTGPHSPALLPGLWHRAQHRRLVRRLRRQGRRRHVRQAVGPRPHLVGPTRILNDREGRSARIAPPAIRAAPARSLPAPRPLLSEGRPAGSPAVRRRRAAVRTRPAPLPARGGVPGRR
jgi:hypothetical protein